MLVLDAEWEEATLQTTQTRVSALHAPIPTDGQPAPHGAPRYQMEAPRHAAERRSVAEKIAPLAAWIVPLLLLPGLAPASAQTLDVGFSGSLAGLIPLSNGGPLTSPETVVGTYSLDPTVPDQDPSPSRGVYPGALLTLSLRFSSGLRVELSGADAFVYDQTAPYPDSFATGTNGTSASDPLVLTDRFGNTGTYVLDFATLDFSAYGSANPDQFLPDDSFPTLLPTDWPFAAVILQYKFASGTPVVSDPPSNQTLLRPQVSVRILDSVRLPIVAAIDIRPGDDTNAVNPADPGTVPVAILGSERFDVGSVDDATLAFGPNGAAPTTVPATSLEDVNGDGFLDLLSHYRLRDTGIAFGDTQACLHAKTVEGFPIEGCDSIQTVPSGCGLGGELVLVLPPLVWLRKRRRKRRSDADAPRDPS